MFTVRSATGPEPSRAIQTGHASAGRHRECRSKSTSQADHFPNSVVSGHHPSSHHQHGRTLLSQPLSAPPAIAAVPYPTSDAIDCICYLGVCYRPLVTKYCLIANSGQRIWQLNTWHRVRCAPPLLNPRQRSLGTPLGRVYEISRSCTSEYRYSSSIMHCQPEDLQCPLN